MGNDWSSGGLRSSHLLEKVELSVGSTRQSYPWELYHAVSADAAGACPLTGFIYALDSGDSVGTDRRHVGRAELLQAAENNAKGTVLGGQPLLIKFPDNPLTSSGGALIEKPAKSSNSNKAAAAAMVSAAKLRGPVNGNECYFWRTTGCQFTTGCRYRHVPEHEGIDKKPWQKTVK